MVINLQFGRVWWGFGRENEQRGEEKEFSWELCNRPRLGKEMEKKGRDGLIYGDDDGAHNLKFFMGLELGWASDRIDEED